MEEDIQAIIKRVNELAGIKESDTGLAPPALWDLAADKQNLANEQPLQVNNLTSLPSFFNSTVNSKILSLQRLLAALKSSMLILMTPSTSSM